MNTDSVTNTIGSSLIIVGAALGGALNAVGSHDAARFATDSIADLIPPDFRF